MLSFQVLLAPVLALMGLTFLCNAVLRNFYETKHEQVAFGVLFGTIVVVGMTNPLSLGDGLIFDTRTLLTGAAVAFAGPVAGFITICFGIICRLFIGGAGTTAGVIGLVLAFLLAFGWAHFMRGRIKNRIVGDGLLGLAITPSILALFVLPLDIAIGLIFSVLPTLTVCNVIGTIAIGLMFRREVRHFDDGKKLEVFAQTDALTNLLNRRGMDDKLGSVKFDANYGHALFYFDIDDFKLINDAYGHDAGDATLAIVAARITESIRREAVFARHGGDEFSIYLPRLGPRDVQDLANRICAAISSEAFSHKDLTFDVSISLGGYWSKRNMPVQDMLDLADTQLLLAKRAGKNRAQVAYGKDVDEADVSEVA
jgi:diguanylate cyclase